MGDAGVEPAPFAEVNSKQDLKSALQLIGTPAILKTSTMGYDGKGQFVIENEEQAIQAYSSLGAVQCVLEQKLALKQEISALLARNAKGEISAYPPAENEHRAERDLNDRA